MRWSRTTLLKEPLACTESERREFARLVRLGFASADESLPDRIRCAKWLAFHYGAGGKLVATAALKAPLELYRTDVFTRAAAPIDATRYQLELGWVYVVPAYRGRRLAPTLCRQLLSRVNRSSVFATTRVDNDPMIGILLSLGFVRTGKPFPRRSEELVLFLRPEPS